jgi:general secretion pathway protein D
MYLMVVVFLSVPFSVCATESAELAAVTASAIAGPIDLIDMKDIDIRDALKFLAQKTGLRIVAGDNVQGRVTIYAEKVGAEEALGLMLGAEKLAYVKDGNVILVMPAADYEARFGRPFSQRTTSKLVHLQGLKAGKAAALLEKMKGSFGRIIPDETSGTVFLDDTAPSVEAMEKYLKAVDHAIWPRVFVVRYFDVAQLLPRVQEILTPELGSARADAASGKLFVTDTLEKLEEFERFLSEVDVARDPMVFDLSYVKAEDILEAVKSVLTPGAGWAQPGKRQDQLIVADTPSRLHEVAELIAAIDRQEKEVLIEARVVQVVLRNEWRMGVDWEALIRDAHGLKLSSVFGGVGSTQKSSVTVGTLDGDGYRAVLEAIGTDLKSRVLSNPRIAVVNNHEARIMVGSTKPYVTTTTTTPSSGPVTVAEDVKFVDVGVKLVVTPTVHRDGFVTMKIRPEVSSAADSIRTGQNNVIPIIDTSQLETTVRVKDGVTVILGGLIKEEEVRSGSKIPILGDVPIVGGAFRSRSSGKEKTELVIFLTPRIIDGDAGREDHVLETSAVLR